VIYLLDTNILIYLIKNHPPTIAQRIDTLADDDRLCMSFITWAQLLKGAERSDRKPDVLRRLDALGRQVTVIYPTGPEICRHYAEQSTRLAAAGTPIGANDLWIACHALAEDACVVTHNTREFQRIVGLKIEDWVREP
jgi:tRNA(fMet)-specific endonuclease VapC